MVQFDMNDMQRERVKMVVIGVVIGIVATLRVLGRYDLKPDQTSGIAWRFDRLTGHAEMIGPNGQPLVTQGRYKGSGQLIDYSLTRATRRAKVHSVCVRWKRVTYSMIREFAFGS
jgi:hypothetical protein